jgi:hypothetical protein
MRWLIVVAGLTLALAGCAKPGFVTAVRTTTSTPTMPRMIAPHPDWTDRTRNDLPGFHWVEGWGRVLGTPLAIASLNAKLEPSPAPNRTVPACKRQIELGAAQYAHVMVDAASLGPERRTRDGLYEGLVAMTVIYDFHLYHEVRQATLKCYTRPDGSIVDLEAVTPGGQFAPPLAGSRRAPTPTASQTGSAKTAG